MKNVIEMRKKQAAKRAEAQELLNLIDGEKRSFTAEERGQFDAIMGEVDTMESEIETEIRRQQMAMAGAGTKHTPDDENHESEFRNLGELVQAVRLNPSDPRLKELREMAMSSNATGGIFVPTVFSQELFKVDAGQAVARPRATVIPAGDQPDASINFPILNQGAGSNMYGGVQVQWIAEGAAKPDTSMTFEDITLSPFEVAGTMVITDKLLRNAPAMSTMIEEQFRAAIIAAEDTAFITGNGVGKPTGFIGSTAAIKVNRAVAAKVSFADVVAMVGKAKMGGSLAWITSQTVLPQLMTMKDDSGQLIWQANASAGSPGTLLGIPIVISERTPLLGALGDLSLVDLKYYLIKDGAGIFISASEHVLFQQNKTMIKAFWNVDGKPWLDAPVALENGYQVSPFVVLDVPAA